MDATQPKPLTTARLALGVCLGILLAGVISGAIYYFAIVQPQAEAAHVAQIQADTARYEAELQASQLHIAQMQAETEKSDAEYRSQHPDLFYPDGTAKSIHLHYPDCVSLNANTKAYRDCVAKARAALKK